MEHFEKQIPGVLINKSVVAHDVQSIIVSTTKHDAHALRQREGQRDAACADGTVSVKNGLKIEKETTHGLLSWRRFMKTS